MAAAIAIGLAGGTLQGVVITRLKVPPFVATLGGLTAFRGAALWFSEGGPISGFTPEYNWWGQGRVGSIPVPVIIFLVAAAIAMFVLAYTRFGRYVYATGDNAAAADLNGVPTRRVTLMVYVISGFFCGLAGFLLSARLSSAEAVAGLGLELTVIASVVIGGTSLFGGVGGVFGTVIGALLDRRPDQRAGAPQRLLVHPADHHRGHPGHRCRLRSVRLVTPARLSGAGAGAPSTCALACTKKTVRRADR